MRIILKARRIQTHDLVMELRALYCYATAAARKYHTYIAATYLHRVRRNQTASSELELNLKNNVRARVASEAEFVGEKK